MQLIEIYSKSFSIQRGEGFMELTPRIKQILQFVLEKNEPVLEQDIAQHIGVSKRTVQREFDYIAAGLVDYDLSLCKKKISVYGLMVMP